MRKIQKITFLFFMMVFLYPMTAYANSSWHWVTYSPKELLPFAVLITLIIETLGIVKLGKITDLKKTARVVLIANLFSFLFPYLKRAVRFRAVAGGFFSAWDKAFNSGPYYMVMLGYLVLTLIVEIPVVYFSLQSLTKNKKHLLFAVIILNFITTALIFTGERFISHGQW